MANVCPTPIHVCRARLTRLNDPAGTIAAAPNNHVVTDSIVQLTITPVISEGEDIEVKGACDCVCAAYKGRDRLKRFNLQIQLCRLEPALIEILTGASLFTNGSAEPIGNVWPIGIGCNITPQPPVALEAWSDSWVGDAQAAAPNQYIRWVFPRTYWQWDELTLNNEFTLPQFNGWSQTNSAFPGNPYGDNPGGVSSIVGASGQGGGMFDDGPLPNAYCGYSAFST